MARRKLKVDLVHWMPLEMYPPAMNLARDLVERGWDVTIHTTKNRHGLVEFGAPAVKVHRSADASSGNSAAKAFAYSGFHLGTARRLISDPPDAVIYFEPQSSFPVFLALTSARGIPVFVHHHEYHEPDEFEKPGMRLARMFHRLEQRALFPRARWISHTNEARRELFLADNGESLRQKTKILRNLPPRSWSAEPNRAWAKGDAKPLRMVYVGSLSCSDTSIESCVQWVQAQEPGSVTLDIYAYNTDGETATFLQSVKSTAIRFHSQGIPYDDLPHLLRDFHCGLILYRAQTLNYRHNASNKLFEYLACGLDVLFPPSMLGVKPYARMDAAPRVIEADFEKGDVDLRVLASRGGIPGAPPPPDASSELNELHAALIAASASA